MMFASCLGTVYWLFYYLTARLVIPSQEAAQAGRLPSSSFCGLEGRPGRAAVWTRLPLGCCYSTA